VTTETIKPLTAAGFQLSGTARIQFNTSIVDQPAEIRLPRPFAGTIPPSTGSVTDTFKLNPLSTHAGNSVTVSLNNSLLNGDVTNITSVKVAGSNTTTYSYNSDTNTVTISNVTLDQEKTITVTYNAHNYLQKQFSLPAKSFSIELIDITAKFAPGGTELFSVEGDLYYSALARVDWNSWLQAA